MAKKPDAGTNLAMERLKSFINRVERLSEEKSALAADIREVMSEAKAEGFDTKVMRKLIRRRLRDKAELAEEDALLEMYERALGEASK